MASSSSGFALGFLRRLLCAPSTAADSAGVGAPGRLLSAPETDGTSASPCVVARLMGLDAMPVSETPHAQPQLLLRRPRSASAAEAGRSPRGPGDAPPARASGSLREKPAYLRPENDKFLLLSFSPEECTTATKKADGHEDRPDRRRRPRRRKLQFRDNDDDESRRECTAQQGSSPVSVLEARDVHEDSSTTTTTTSSSLEDLEPCTATSEEAQFALEQQSSTRKLHNSFFQMDDMSPATGTVDDSGCSNKERRNTRRINKFEVSTPDDIGIRQHICRLVEEDLKTMEWLTRNGANIVAELDLEILDQIICEATAELWQLSSDAAYSLPLPALTPKICSGKTSKWRYPCPRNLQARQRLQATEYKSMDCLAL